MIKLRVANIILAIGILLAAAPALAHKVSVFGYVEDGQILGEGYFPGGGKAKGCQVDLLDSSGKVLAQTKTDGAGAYKLKLPQAKAPLTLVLTASMGHKGEYVLNAKDLGQMPAGKQSTPEKKADPTASAAPAASAAVDAQALASMVEKALDRKLAPLNAQIAKMNAERQISLSDVIGGLGYILGLLGLAAYMKSRKTK